MPEIDVAPVTELLRLSSRGDKSAEARLLEVLDEELRWVAVRCMKAERRDHTLQPTALVNEAYLRLKGQQGRNWQNRGHFLAVATQIMRRVLIDHARARRSEKRAGRACRVDFDEAIGSPAAQWAEELLDLDAALARLAQLDPRQVRIIELRFYGGLTEAEIALEVGVSERTVKREWKVGRAWLFGELQNFRRERGGARHDKFGLRLQPQ